MADFIEEIGHCVFWLPGRDARQNFFVYHFGFLMNPKKKNHPRTEYMFQRLYWFGGRQVHSACSYFKTDCFSCLRVLHNVGTYCYLPT